MIWALSFKNNSKSNYYYLEESKNRIRKLIEENDQIFKFHLDRFKYSSRYKDEGEQYHFEELRKIIQKWNKLLTKCNGNYYWLIEGKETFADWCLFPFIRQYKIACIQKKFANYFEEPMCSWLNYYEKHSNFKKIMVKFPTWVDN